MDFIQKNTNQKDTKDTQKDRENRSETLMNSTKGQKGQKGHPIIKKVKSELIIRNVSNYFIINYLHCVSFYIVSLLSLLSFSLPVVGYRAKNSVLLIVLSVLLKF